MVSYNLEKIKNPFHVRLALDHMNLDELCDRSDKLEYEVLQRYGSGVPYEYLVTYKVKSITSVDGNQNPIYGEEHKIKITLPEGYPSVEGNPKCFAQTDIWHPNIKHDGELKGRICYTAKALGAWSGLDMLVNRIGEILQYKNYHAVDVDPWPEDTEVAKWVREYAEPNDIINKEKNIFVDSDYLLNPEHGVELPSERRKRISIQLRRKGTGPSTPVPPTPPPPPLGAVPPPPPPPPQRRRITISRKNKNQ